MKYKNTNSFTMILDSNDGRLTVGPHQEFESNDELVYPGILKLTGHVKEVEALSKEPVFGTQNKLDLKTELQKRFHGRFGN